MVKSYKLASLTGLLVLCSGLHAMDYIKQENGPSYTLEQNGEKHFNTGIGKPYTSNPEINQPPETTDATTKQSNQNTVVKVDKNSKNQNNLEQEKEEEEEKKGNQSKTTKKPTKVREVKKKRTKSNKKTNYRWKKQITHSIILYPFKKLIIKGCLSSNSEETPILTIKFKPSVNKRPTLECTKKQFPLIQKFLKIKNKSIKSIYSSLTEVEKRILNNEEKLRKLSYQNKKDERLEISINEDNNLEWFKKFKKYCESLKISPKLFVTLCIPKDWKVHINGKDTNIIGYLYNPISDMILKNCKVSLNGESKKEDYINSVFYLENSTFNKKKNDNGLILNGKVEVNLIGSYFKCWTNTKNYSESRLIKNGLRGSNYRVVRNPLIVSGTANEKSTTCFNQKYTKDFIEYDETSNRTYIPFKDCIRS